MALATTLGREEALKALAARREENKTRERVDDAKLPAGSPMHYECLTCGAEIRVPETCWNPPSLCKECFALKECGWLE